MKFTAILQARMGSSRLPGKVLKLLSGVSVLGHVISRVKVCKSVAHVIVATTDCTADDAVAVEAMLHGVEIFRGSEQDVLARYYNAASSFGAENIIRVTADCPLFDPELLDRMITQFEELRRSDLVDYMSNTLTRTYPHGLDAEIFTFTALKRSFHEADKAYQREHVTPYIYQHPEFFRLENFRGTEDLSNHRWTLDTKEDLRFMQAVYEALSRPGERITTDAVLKLEEERPGIAALNAHIRQKDLEA